MGILEIFEVRGFTLVIGSSHEYPTEDNCVVFDKQLSEDSVELRLRDKNGNEAGQAKIRALEKFKSLTQPLLHKIYSNEGVMGKTLSEIRGMETAIGIQSIDGKLSIR